jgi:hypothetical protein
VCRCVLKEKEKKKSRDWFLSGLETAAVFSPVEPPTKKERKKKCRQKHNIFKLKKNLKRNRSKKKV